MEGGKQISHLFIIICLFLFSTLSPLGLLLGFNSLSTSFKSFTKSAKS